MASYQFLNHPNQVRNSLSTQVRHGRSKAQVCLANILRIISSFPPDPTSKQSSSSSGLEGTLACGIRNNDTALLCGDGRFDVDLNRSAPPPNTEEFEFPPGEGGLSSFSADAGEGGAEVCLTGRTDSAAAAATATGFPMVDNNLEGECALKEEKLYGNDSFSIEANPNDEEEYGVVEEKVKEFSEITKTQIQSSEIHGNGVSKETQNESEAQRETHQQQEDGQNEELRGDGCLGLLIDAANQIFGDFRDDESEPQKPSQEEDVLRLHEFIGEEGHELTGTETAIDESPTNRLKRNQRWTVDLYGDFEDTSPVVRSKRGRTQVLPYKYRDSVLEPLTRLTRHRSTTTSSKKRSR